MKKALFVSIVLAVLMSLPLISRAGGRYVGVARGTIKDALVTSYDSDTVGIAVKYAGNYTSGTTSCYTKVTTEDDTKLQLDAMGSYVRVCGWREFNEGSTRNIKWS